MFIKSGTILWLKHKQGQSPKLKINERNYSADTNRACALVAFSHISYFCIGGEIGGSQPSECDVRIVLT